MRVTATLVFLTLLPLNVFSKVQTKGVMNGGGGQGVLCHKDGQTTLSLLDIYELKEVWQLKPIKNKPNNMNEALNFLTKRIAHHFWNPITIEGKKYEDNIRETLDSFKLDMIDKRLKFTNDSLPPIQDSDCEYVQIAQFYIESKILVDKKYWDLLDYYNKAALLAHEIIYLIERDRGARNSDLTRKFVSYLFSETPLRGFSEGMPKDKSQIFNCSAYENIDDGFSIFSANFFIFNFLDSNGNKQNLEFVFNFIRGNYTPNFVKSLQDKSGIYFDDLKNTDYYYLEKGVIFDSFKTSRLSAILNLSRDQSILGYTALKGNILFYDNIMGPIGSKPWEVHCQLIEEP